mgnify:CR=1 FL=1
MPPEQHHFYGRERELHLLFSAWQQALEGKPQWIAFGAETGTGKTRLVQEFYRYISDVEYRQAREDGNPEKEKCQKDYDPAKYWPSNLPIEKHRLGLNPDPEGLTDEKIESLKDIPWLWWGMRGEDPGRRNPSEGGCAARDALSHLEIHIALLAIQKAREEARRHAGMQIGKWALSNIPVAGPMFQIAFEIGELVHSGKRPFETLLNGLGIRLPDERKKLQLKFQDLLVDSVFAFLEQGRPVILVLDDAHWFDPDSVAFVDRLVERAGKQSTKLMIVSTSWAREWDQSAIRRVFDRFKHFHRHSCEVLPLGGIDNEHAHAFLLSNFSGLCEADKELLADRANGNFRYLTELVIALGEDPDTFFEGEKFTSCLSADGREEVRSTRLEMDALVNRRFLALDKLVQQALIRSSYQGVRFDPGLTSQVTKAVDPEDGGCEKAAIEAINHAERPGAMICSVEGDLREFLQGPYWRLIRNRLERNREEFDAIREAYRQIVIDGNRALADSIVESLVVQVLEREQGQAQKIRLRAMLLEAAARSSRYQAGLHQLAEIAAAMAELKQPYDGPPLLFPREALAALRIFNQYAFSAGEQRIRGSLEDLCTNNVCPVLQGPLLHYLKDKALPEGCDLPALIEWCEALVGFRQGLGHIEDYPIWLNYLCELRAAQVESGLPTPNARLRLATSLLRLAEFRALRAKDRAGWDEVFDIFGKQVKPLVEQLAGQERSILLAWLQISVLYFGQAGRSHYPEQQDWGDDYRNYGRCADLLGDTLAEVEIGSTDGASDGLKEFGDDVLEALLHAAALTIKFAYKATFPIAPEFLDRLSSVSKSASTTVFERIRRGGHVPISLACAALDSDLTRLSMVHRLSSGATKSVESEVATIAGVRVLRVQSRVVARSEPEQIINQVSAAEHRYRELGILSVEMIRIFAALSYERLELMNAATREAAEKAFAVIVGDAILIRDGYRVPANEKPQLLEWLVRIFDGWLADSPDADKLWTRLREGYSDCDEERFGKLVMMIRSDDTPEIHFGQTGK